MIFIRVKFWALSPFVERGISRFFWIIYDNISENKIIQMSQHNIILVVPKKIKAQQKLSSKQSVIDFETYFLKEIPLIMDYWRSQNV
ncbi:MAG: hypothetical protein IE909_16090 [Campylobacterales bacterium]|nr:hypothetical protein [Campylobacterales bacterium]